MFHQYFKLKSQIIWVGGQHGRRGKYHGLQMVPIRCLIPDRNWQRHKHFILWRQLIDQNRATRIILNEKKLLLVDQKLDTDTVIRNLFTDVSLDVFRNVMTFFI